MKTTLLSVRKEEAVVVQTKIHELASCGQSAWLDNISRTLIKTGKIDDMIIKGALGITSNPTIFDNAISKSSDYDKVINELSAAGKSTFEIYDELTVRDIQDAADLFLPIYEHSEGTDGFVSLEVDPRLAHKTDETIAEAKRIHAKVNRPNLMVKVPATSEGEVAIEELIAAGVNVNATLIFSLDQYVQTAQAFLRGMKRLSQERETLGGVASVASVFVSRIDTVVDAKLDELIVSTPDEHTQAHLAALKGKAAVANAKIIYEKYDGIFSSPVFEELKKQDALKQRVLWASTGTKNPSYRDVKYVEELVGKDTVNTMPDKTLAAFLDHGVVKDVVGQAMQMAHTTIRDLRNFGIVIDEVCNELLKKGVVAFEKSFDSLLSSIEHKRNVLCKR